VLVVTDGWFGISKFVLFHRVEIFENHIPTFGKLLRLAIIALLISHSRKLAWICSFVKE
jgi:hypothetical protein